MRAVLLSVACILTSFFIGCTKGDLASSAKSGVDRDKLCAVGGAQYDAKTNECACPAGKSWDGARCGPATAPSPSSVDPIEMPDAAQVPSIVSPAPFSSPHDAEATEPSLAIDELVPPPLPESALETREKLRHVCRRAKAHWIDADAYCHCPNGQVLVAAKCRTLPGRVTDDACRRAPTRGKWLAGLCECSPGLVFSPSRGGCVQPFEGSVAVKRRICESSLNNGKWDARNERCRCPEGRVTVGEICQVQQRLSSREVCESSFNKGTWNKDARRCECKSDQLWVDQTCRSLRSVDTRMACESEINGGTWNAKLTRCICPGLTRWRPESKTCR